MRLRLPPLLLLLLSPVLADPAAGGSGSLYPPGLLPLINRANALLSVGQFADAAKIYTEALEQSPTDYLLHYKRATAYLSLQRHASALDDFDKVLSLTQGTFDNAHLMKARIYTKEGEFEKAREALGMYKKAKKGKVEEKEEIEALEAEIGEGVKERKRTETERRSELWNACVESATRALRIASHSIDIRNWRAECEFAAGDYEGAVGDLTRLSHLLPPSTTLLTHIFTLSYFLLPPSPAPLNALKQCLHYDPDSRPCLSAHKFMKNLDKQLTNLAELEEKQDWRGVVKVLMEEGKRGKGEVWKRFGEGVEEWFGVKGEKVVPLVPVQLLDVSASSTATSTSTTTPVSSPKKKKSKSKSPTLPLPNPSLLSPMRATLLRSLCKAYTHLSASSSGSDAKFQMNEWCSALLSMKGYEEDVDGLVGKGESLLAKEEWEEAVRVFEKAFEVGGRGDRDVHARLTRAQKLLKQSKQKDYYKILDVSRDADARTIKKAFRRQAKLAHPDKGGTEAKMALLNEAYEVLSNPELRQRFDNGEDPMDPMAQQGGHPFAHGQHPFAHFFHHPGASGGGRRGPGGQGSPFEFHFGH